METISIAEIFQGCLKRAREHMPEVVPYLEQLMSVQAPLTRQPPARKRRGGKGPLTRRRKRG
jgi:hypothetical protein